MKKEIEEEDGTVVTSSSVATTDGAKYPEESEEGCPKKKRKFSRIVQGIIKKKIKG